MRRAGVVSRLLAILVLALGAAALPGATPALAGGKTAFVQTGTASWYGHHFQHRRTATGERFDVNALTAAHPTLPLGSLVRVTNLGNGRSVLVRINDRNDASTGRVIDLSPRAARKLDMLHDGLATVRVEVLSEVAADRG